MSNNFEKSLRFTKVTLLFSGIKMEPGEWDFLFKIFFKINLVWLQTDVLGELFWLVEGIQMGKSFLELSYISPCATVSVLASVKAFFFYKHQGVFIKLVEKLKSIHPEIKEEHTNELNMGRTKDKNGELNDVIETNITESTKFLNRLIGFDLVMCVVVAVAFAFLPISVMGYEYSTTGTYNVSFPFNVKFFFDHYDRKVWPYVYFKQIWSTFIVMNTTVGTDTFFFAFCVYSRMHFNILQWRFQDVVARSWDEGKRQFVAVVTRHQELIHLVDQVEILYSKSMLFNIITSSVLICLSAFNVASSSENMGVVFLFMTFLFMNLIQIFLMCYFGDMLMSSSVAVSDAIYNSLWYQADQRMKRNVLSVLIRSRKPCKLTAARFVDVNLTAFTTILSRSWSLFALLKTVYK